MIRNIVLAEDDRGSAFLMKSVLQKNGYHVLLAENGLEAMQLVLNNPVDLVITDVVMPKMDGVDLYDELKKRESTQHIPVIIITDKDVFKEAFAVLGVEHFIPKNFDINVLLDKVRSIDTSLQKKQYKKILICGNNDSVLEQMRKILTGGQHLVTTADSVQEIFQKIFMIAPHIILLDLRISNDVQARELIKAIRCFSIFHKVKIVTYVYLQPEEMEYGLAHWQIIEDEASTCKELGEARFIGNFSQVTFLDQVKDLL